MIRFLIRIAVFIVSAALGLFVASLLITGFYITASGFVTSVLVFAVIQSLLTPIFSKLTEKHARALLGGVGLLSTFVALLIAHLFTKGLTIVGVSAWLASTLVVWVITALATWLLPFLFVRKKVDQRRANGAS